jgi:predicted MarR family transcription regulator
MKGERTMKLADIQTREYDGGFYAVELCSESVGMTLYFGKSIDDARWHLAKQIEKAVAEEYGLTDYYEWKKWLLSDQAAYGNNDYHDNWCFVETEDTAHETLAEIAAFGEKWHLVRTTRRHKVSGKTFDAYEVFSDRHYNCCEALCGFRF